METAKTSPEMIVSAACNDSGLVTPEKFIFVDVDKQTLACCKRLVDNKMDPHTVNTHDMVMSCKVSTSRFGIGNREGSNMTPLGLHKIVEKIGDTSLPWTIFKSRVDTGEIWRPGMDGENQILTRILRLRGLEQGLNAGEGIDSYDRYIYIHGTNREDLIGTPMSHGCVCMKNDDIITLYNMVEVGTIVFIWGKNYIMERGLI